MAGRHKLPKFTIEDAFEEDADDAIRIYGSTNERSPLSFKTRHSEKEHTDGNSQIEEPMLGLESKSHLGISVPDVDVS